MPRPISVTVSMSALRHNLDCIKSYLQRVAQARARVAPAVWAVIKANAYGHGTDCARQAFSQADGLALLDLDEAVRCREAGWHGPIMLLEGFFQPGDVHVLRDYSLTAVIHSQEQLDMLRQAPSGPPLDAWIKLNTGMHRLGFGQTATPDACAQARQLQQAGHLGRLGIMTHFARADDNPAFTRLQLDRFQAWAQGLTQDASVPVSVCNSAASFSPDYWTAFEPDREQWVRAGIGLYGASPFVHLSAADLGLQPAMTLQAQLIGVQQVRQGEGVGYGHAFTAPRDMRVGVVACGYADGYPRHAANGTPVTVMGVRTQLVGRVSMDMLLVDLGPLPQAGVGAPVILWGQGGPGVDEVARASGTIGYELLCAVAPRVPRVVQALPADSAGHTVDESRLHRERS